MYLAAKRRPPPYVESMNATRPVLDRARDPRFSHGKTDGEDLLHALYDDVLDEPVPERLTALLKR